MANPFCLLKMVRNSVSNQHAGHYVQSAKRLYGLIDLQSTWSERVNLSTSSINLIPKHL
jgi:hypothetical protein